MRLVDLPAPLVGFSLLDVPTLWAPEGWATGGEAPMTDRTRAGCDAVKVACLHMDHVMDRDGRVFCGLCSQLVGELCTGCHGARGSHNETARYCTRCGGWGWLKYAAVP